MNKNIIQKIGALIRPLLLLLFAASALTTNAQSSNPARVTLEMKNVPVEQVMRAIEQQTDYVFLNRDVDVKQIVSVGVVDKTVPEALSALFGGIDVDYKIEARHIVISRHEHLQTASTPVTISGRVLDANGEPVVGAAVIVKDTTIGTSTDIDGSYSLQVPPPIIG